MSLARLALRLAAVEALCPWSAIQGGPYPTPAGPRVYDSRQQPIDGLSDLETKPILIVYTEDDASTPYEGARRNADEQIVVLVVEEMIAAKAEVEFDAPDGSKSTIGTLVSPISDPQQEMLLDLLEAAVRRLLDTRNEMPSSAALARVAMEIRRVESQPQRADDKATRLAARTLKLHIKVKPDAWPTSPAVPAPTGLTALPEPLRSVAAVLDPASDGGQACAAIAVLVPGAPPAPVALAGIGITTDVDRDPENKFPTQVFSEAAPPTPMP
jgi:hypothetical protein